MEDESSTKEAKVENKRYAGKLTKSMVEPRPFLKFFKMSKSEDEDGLSLRDRKTAIDDEPQLP